MITKQTFIRGGKKGVSVIADLAIYFIPAVFLIKILEHSGLLIKIADFFAPYMAYMGLPGEGALVFLLGQASMYSAVAAVAALGWTAKQITIIGLLLSICHSFIVETAVISKGGANGPFVVTMRLLAAVLAGVALNIVIPGV